MLKKHVVHAHKAHRHDWWHVAGPNWNKKLRALCSKIIKNFQTITPEHEGKCELSKHRSLCNCRCLTSRKPAPFCLPRTFSTLKGKKFVSGRSYNSSTNKRLQGSRSSWLWKTLPGRWRLSSSLREQGQGRKKDIPDWRRAEFSKLQETWQTPGNLLLLEKVS